MSKKIHEKTHKLLVTLQDLAIDNSTIVRDIHGRIVRAEVGDLDANDSPEIYVCIKASARGESGELAAFPSITKIDERDQSATAQHKTA